MDQCIRHYCHDQIRFTLFCESCAVICDLWYIFHILYFQMIGTWCATMPLNHCYHHHNIVFVVYWFPKKESVIKSVTWRDCNIPVMVLRFRTDTSGQTVLTLGSLIRVYTVCHSVCIFWTQYCMIKPHCSKFRIITAIFPVSEFLEFYGSRTSSCFRHLVRSHSSLSHLQVRGTVYMGLVDRVPNEFYSLEKNWLMQFGDRRLLLLLPFWYEYLDLYSTWCWYFMD